MTEKPRLINLKRFVDTQRKTIFRHILTKCAEHGTCNDPQRHEKSAKADRLLKIIWERKFGKELQKNLSKEAVADYEAYLQLPETEAKALMKGWKKISHKKFQSLKA